MKRTSGRIGVGLVLVSTLIGACLTEQEKGDVPAAVAQPEAAFSGPRDAKDIVLAVRTQLERAFGKKIMTLPGLNTPRPVVDSFDVVGANAINTIEFLWMNGVKGEGAKLATKVALPARADGAFQLRDASSGVSIAVALIGAAPAAREDANGYVVYRSGYVNGAHILHRPTERGTEDYVFFPDKLPETPELRYEISLGEDVAGLRFVENTLEMLDAKGAPRLRMAPPYAVDGDARRLALNVAIEGCAYDSSPDLPWDRPVVAPGATHCTVRLSWDPNVRAPLTIDPAWANTGDLSVPRLNATTSEMAAAKSRVIVVGGDPGDPTQAYKTTEVYDEFSGTWAMFKSMTEPRTQHGMVPFSVQNISGLVVTGGKNNNGVIAGTERLDLGMSAGGWQKFGMTGLTSARAMHTTTTIDNNRILVTGGIDNAGNPLNTVEVYYLLQNVWQQNPTGLSSPRIGHTANLGKNGAVVVIAGGTASSSAALNSLDYCDGTLDTPNCFALPGTLMSPRAFHKTIREVVAAGNTGIRLYFIGGQSGTAKVASVEVFDTVNKVFLPPTGALTHARSNFDAMLLNGNPTVGNGSKILVTGGYGEDGSAMKSVELFDTLGAVPNKPWEAGPDMVMPRARHTMAALSEGRILAIGGTSDKGSSEVLQCSTDSECPVDKFCADGFCCNTPCKGVCEACNSNAPGHTPGTCVPIAGDPREGHGDCIEGDGDSLNCSGKCDGFDALICTYPVGKPCGKACVAGDPQSTAQSLTCGDKGLCDVIAFESSCNNFTCLDEDTCNTKCAKDADCIKGYQCNVTSGACIENQAQCGTDTNADGTVEDVLVSTADKTVIVGRCGAYHCDTVKSECLTVCATAYDCAAGFTCNLNKTCSPKDFEDTAGEAVSCSASPVNESSRFGWLAALVIAGAVAARRNRARA